MDKRVVNRQSESGAVLAFVAILLLAILMYFGFVMDVNMLASSREQSQHFARFAALTALEQYHDPNLRCDTAGGELVAVVAPAGTPCTNCQKYQLAIQKVNDLIPENAILNKLEYGTNDPSAQKIVPVLYADPEHASCEGLPEAPEGAALLVPGLMLADDEDSQDAADRPCATSGRRSPCFQPMEDNGADQTVLDNDSNAPSAFAVRGDYYQGLSHWWSEGLLNASDSNLHVDAIATLIPRRGCFLVDLSASSVRNTHERKKINRSEYREWLVNGTEPPQPNLWGNEFAYFLGCPIFSDPSDPAQDRMQNCRRHGAEMNGDGLGSDEFLAENNMGGAYDWRSGNHSLWSNHDRTWEWLRLSHPDNSSTRDATHHVRNDYVTKHVYGDDDFDSDIHGSIHPDPAVDPEFSTGTDPGAWFQIDMGYRDRSSVGGYTVATDYAGPEPLRSILAGIKHAIAFFEQRQVAGDMACIIFYDKSLSWPRVFTITDNFANLSAALDFDGTVPSSFLQADPATDIDVAPTTTVSGFEAFVRHGLFPRNPDNSFTNSVIAVKEALQQLTQAREESGIESADFIVHIGDGLTNCLSCTGADAGDGLCPSRQFECSNEYRFYKQAMLDLKTMIETDIWQEPDIRNIPIHVFMIGDSVGPHSLDIEAENSTDGEDCVSPDKVNGSGFPPVRGTPGDDAAKRDAFNNASAANPFWQANVDWYEIAKLTRGMWAPIRRQFPAGTNTCPLLEIDEDGDPCDVNTYGIGGTDRRDFDPFCEDKGTQIGRYLDLVLGDNPFKLAEPQW